jgi:hypothetical protein
MENLSSSSSGAEIESAAPGAAGGVKARVDITGRTARSGRADSSRREEFHLVAWREEFHHVLLVIGIGIALGLGGCSRDSVSSYEVPKEEHSGVKVANVGRREAVPTVQWAVLPKGWEENKESDAMSVARFRIPGEGGNYANVGITPLLGMARAPFVEGRVVQMWAGELNLPEPTNGIPTTPVEIGGLPGKLYDLTSVEPTFEGRAKTRMTIGVAARGGTLWFVKLSGAQPVVAAQQGNFREFLKSLTFQDPPGADAVGEAQVAAGSAPASAAPAGGGHPEWKAPADWKEVAPANKITLAEYNAQTASGSKAKITVTPLSGMGGDLLANVNRWRRQIGLGPIEDADLEKNVKRITLADGSAAALVHAQGATQTVHGLVVPRGKETWFYKILGDDEAVNAEAERLLTFAATAK